MTVTATDLGQYDIVLVVDKSGSMSTGDGPGGLTRWQYAQESALALATEAARFDSNGIDVAVFSDSFKLYENVIPDKITQVWQENSPFGSTATDVVLKSLFDRYFAAKAAGSVKPTIIQVITDGAPNDKVAVARVIIEATKKMDRDEELAVQFIQFGNDSAAREFLRQLDDDLQGQGAKFDIVDSKTVEEAGSIPLAELIVQALND